MNTSLNAEDAPLPAYIENVLGQPEALSNFLEHGLSVEVATTLERLVGTQKRVVITGMGASAHACYPLFLRLARHGCPAWAVETAELLQQRCGLVAAGTLLIVISQSGESAEVVALTQSEAFTRATVLAIVNDLSSTLARCADLVVDMRAGEESGVGTRSFVNSLAATMLIADGLTESDESRHDLDGAPDALAAYFADWRGSVEEAQALQAGTGPLLILGRGASLAAARTGALVIKEAAKVNAEGMSSSEFRHGPLELADAAFRAVVLAGQVDDLELNRRTMDAIIAAGADAAWLAAEPGGGLHFPRPACHNTAIPIAEIAPLQMLSIALAEARGITPGVFRHISRITTVL